jgi:hypothetical protein
MKIKIQSANNSITKQLIDLQDLVSDKVKSNQDFISFAKNYKYNDSEEITIEFDEEKVKLQEMKDLLDSYKIETTEVSENTLKKFFTDIFKKLEVKAQEQQNNQNQQNQQKYKVVEKLTENLEEKYNFSIPLGDNPEKKIERFRVVNKANGSADVGDKIFTDELEKAFYCTAKVLYVDTEVLKANLENKSVKEAWWGILSKLGFDWDNNKIKITEHSKGQNNPDVIGKKGLNRKDIKQAIEAEEAKRKEEEAKRKEEEVEINKFPECNTVKLGLLNIKPEVNVHQLFQNLHGINFHDIEISKKTFTFDVKKYGSLFEIVAEDEKNGGSYRFQLDEASANQEHYKKIYDLIKGENDCYDFKADEEIQKTLNEFLKANKIQNSNSYLPFSYFNNNKKDAIINENAEAYSYSYYRDAKKNTDINVNFGLLQEEIKNQNDFERLIYEQGVKSEFFVKVNDNNGEYVKFSLYWDEDKGKPAIHLAKSLNGNIDLYGSNHELCDSVAKDKADFKDIKVSFQLYYNLGKIKDKDDNKALCFINDPKIGDFFDSSKASDLDLNSLIVTNKATKEITAKDRPLTQDEKNVEIAKIDIALEKGLEEAFPEQNGAVNQLISIIAKFVKGDESFVMPNEIQSETDKSEVNQLKERYQAKLTDINKPANLIDNQKLNSKSKNFTPNFF